MQKINKLLLFNKTKDCPRSAFCVDQYINSKTRPFFKASLYFDFIQHLRLFIISDADLKCTSKILNNVDM